MLDKLFVKEGTRKKKKIVGRGPGSGYGCKSGRGNKGQKSRSGGNIPKWFEGGQMPLQRRVIKRGFKNINRIDFQVINVGQLQSLIEKGRISSDKLLKREDFFELHMIKKSDMPIKLLGKGEILKPVKIEVDRVSKSARDKIEKAGGKVEEIVS